MWSVQPRSTVARKHQGSLELSVLRMMPECFFSSVFCLPFIGSAVIRCGLCAFILTLRQGGSKQLLIHSNLRATPLFFPKKTNGGKHTVIPAVVRQQVQLRQTRFLGGFEMFQAVSAALTQLESWFGSVFIAAC